MNNAETSLAYLLAEFDVIFRNLSDSWHCWQSTCSDGDLTSVRELRKALLVELFLKILDFVEHLFLGALFIPELVF